MNVNAMTPAPIKHIRYSRHDDMKQLANAAATAIHMPKGERNLLAYYATQSSGFTPSLQAIANATGQSRSSVDRNRQKLVDHGIALTVINGKRRTFFIDWSRVKLYGTLDPAMTRGDRVKFMPLVPPGPRPQTVLKPSDLRFMPLDELITRLARLDPESWENLLRNTGDRA